MPHIPKVTVLVSAYNPGRFLEPMVQSIEAQTFQDWELVVVDDESPEDVSYIESRSPKIRLIRRKNGGMYVARNTGILGTKGEYIAFIDQDDLWAPTKLEKQVAAMDADPLVGLCHCGAEVVDGDGKFLRPSFSKPASGYKELLNSNRIMNCSTMVRRSTLASVGLFDPYYFGVGDYDLWLRIARVSKLAYIPTIEAYWRSHGGNFSKKFDLMFRELTHLYETHMCLAREQNQQDMYEAARRGLRQTRIDFSNNYLLEAWACLAKGEKTKFWEMYINAIKLSPRIVVKPTLQHLFGRSAPRPAAAPLPVSNAAEPH